MARTLSKLAKRIFGDKNHEIEQEMRFEDIDEISELYLANPQFNGYEITNDFRVQLSILEVYAKKTDDNQWDIRVECSGSQKVSILGITEPDNAGGTIFAHGIKPFAAALENIGYKDLSKTGETTHTQYVKKDTTTDQLFDTLQQVDIILTADEKARMLKTEHLEALNLHSVGIRTQEAIDLYRPLKIEARRLKSLGVKP